jgi:glycosyltransferase involved in cell wall biosynthesis
MDDVSPQISTGQKPQHSVARKLRILFVCGADFRAPTEKVVLGYALGLLEQGHRVLIAIRGDPRTADAELPGGELPAGLSILDYGFLGPILRRRDRRVVARFRPDVVHAFNPRFDIVRAIRGFDRATAGAPVVVHFEDDEWGLASGAGGSPARRLARRGARLLAFAYPPAWRLATPGSLRWVSRYAAAFEAITPALASHVSSTLGRECQVLLPVHPAVGPGGPAAVEPDLPAELGDRDRLVFTGAVFASHASDFRLLVEATGELKRRGHDAALLYAGASAPRFDLRDWARQAGLDGSDFVPLGYLDPTQLQGLLRAATVLVQPGAASEFNRLRLPSKLQAYLASGTPTVTFGCGAGELFEDRREVLKTYGDTPTELADRIEEVLTDPALRQELGKNGPRAAERLFDRSRNCEVLTDIYRGVLEHDRRSAPEPRQAAEEPTR